MKRKKIIPLFFALCMILSFYHCKKEKESLPPAINFKTGVQYTQNNAVVAIGRSLTFGIQARGTSSEITNFTIKKGLKNGSFISVMDTGLYSMSLELDKIFYQNVEDTVTWFFSVMDRNHLSASVSLVIYKDPNSKYGGIYYYPSVKLGYQNNTQYGHFLSTSDGKVYVEDSATAHQAQVDVLCYYILSENLPSPVLSSPGEMDNYSTEAKTFYPCIVNWTKRNFTLWDISVDDTPVSDASFDQAQNDSLLIVSYHEVWGKKKFRWATAGRVIPFQTATGKKGLMKVVTADHADTGYMELAIKIQQ